MTGDARRSSGPGPGRPSRGYGCPRSRCRAPRGLTARRPRGRPARWPLCGSPAPPSRSSAPARPRRPAPCLPASRCTSCPASVLSLGDHAPGCFRCAFPCLRRGNAPKTERAARQAGGESCPKRIKPADARTDAGKMFHGKRTIFLQFSFIIPQQNGRGKRIFYPVCRKIASHRQSAK